MLPSIPWSKCLLEPLMHYIVIFLFLLPMNPFHLSSFFDSFFFGIANVMLPSLALRKISLYINMHGSLRIINRRKLFPFLTRLCFSKYPYILLGYWLDIWIPKFQLRFTEYISLGKEKKLCNYPSFLGYSLCNNWKKKTKSLSSI